jgi:hypothetical protein
VVTRRALVTANNPSSLILFALMMEAICSSEMWVLTRAMGRHIPEDDILQIKIALIKRGKGI